MCASRCRYFSGRKTNCFIYGLLYGGACLTKHFADFNILMIGRLLGGIATSILYSAFESWLVFEHNKVCREGGAYRVRVDIYCF